MAYPRELVARIKGALRAGLEPKQISYHTQIPTETIREWWREDRMASVEADPRVSEEIRQAILGKFLGRICTR